MVEKSEPCQGLNEIYLYVNRPYLKLASWESAFDQTPRIKVVEDQLECDAFLSSASYCDRYGCISGGREDTFGKNYLFDVRESRVEVSSYLISNAIWREDPPLLLAIQKRLAILKNSLHEFAAQGAKIKTLLIDCAIFGFWEDSTEKECEDAIAYLAKELPTFLI